MNIEQAARAEHDAEQGRSQAEAAWRAAWWQTTLALASATGDGAATRAVRAAAQILNQSESYLFNRRRTGRAFLHLEVQKIIFLPPRLAMAYVSANGDPAQAITRLQDAEARELSLRDFAAELGTQPVSWQREDERSAAPPAQAIQNWTTEQKGQAARDLLADPEVAEEAMADLPTRVRATKAVHAAQDAQEDQVQQDRKRRTEDGQRPDFEGAIAVRRVLVDLDELVVDAGRMPKIIPDGYKAQLARKAAQAKPTIDWLASLAAGGDVVPDDLSELGEPS